MSEKARTTAGRWAPGASGNPSGRRPGSGRLGALRAQILDAAPAVIERLIEQALGGDVQAAKLLLERCLPRLREAESRVEVALPRGPALARSSALLAAVDAGLLAPGQAVALAALLDSHEALAADAADGPEAGQAVRDALRGVG